MAYKQLHGLIQSKIEKAKHELFTGMPAKVVSYDVSTQTCSAQPVFQTGELPMPPIAQVPVMWPCGGGAVLTFPLKKGDIIWLMFSMYPLAEFLMSDGKAAVSNDMSRPHDISECVAIAGMGTLSVNYKPDPDNVMLRYGSTLLTFDNEGQATLTGKLHVTGEIVSDEKITGKDFESSTLGITFNNHGHHYFWTDGAGDSDTEPPS
ncbi:hypothetical protein Arno162_93 [Pectobacterium phage Arno162]|uniref:Phage protein Gp138 N-terminal domain-containing protein n=1 Tax=Pectobacterium phage Arno162 TaxID=2500577 RepID=A0A678ZX94_9CAUD|nr:hypothetical protein Arno162_93 [Pectobacterium phage Arno162]